MNRDNVAINENVTQGHFLELGPGTSKRKF